MPSDSLARAGVHGRYVIGDEIASGGMATVYLGRMLGDAGFARTVAIKRLHPQLAKDPEVCAMLLDEGRLAARIHHLNVVTTLDVVASGSELFVVMEYVHGEPLSVLIRAALRRGERMPPRIVAAVLSGALRGLHAAHEARDARGEPLGVVHRDVSPQNILVGSDGVARVLDFGIAKAAGRAQVTTDGRIKGKFGYMPPEQLHGEVLDRRADVYAAGVVLWEALVGARLFAGSGDQPDFARLLEAAVEAPSTRVRGLSHVYDAVALRALAREAEGRFSTALEMAEALEACGPVAPAAEVGAWVTDVAGDLLAEMAGRIAAVESRLVTGIRDSLHLIEASEVRVTHLERHAPSTSHSAISSNARPRQPPPARLPPPNPRPGRGSVVVWTGAAVLGAVAVAATFAILTRVPGARAVVPSVEPSSSAREAPPVSAIEAIPPALRVSAEPPASAVTSAAPWPTASPPLPARRPAGEACSPPFTIDTEGHKHYKRACLR